MKGKPMSHIALSFDVSQPTVKYWIDPIWRYLKIKYIMNRTKIKLKTDPEFRKRSLQNGRNRINKRMMESVYREWSEFSRDRYNKERDGLIKARQWTLDNRKHLNKYRVEYERKKRKSLSIIISFP